MAKSIMLEDAAITRAIQNLNNALSGIVDINNSLLSETNKLFDNWEGDSKKEFQAEFKKINSKSVDLTSALEDMKSQLQSIKDAFESADSEMKMKILEKTTI